MDYFEFNRLIHCFKKDIDAFNNIYVYYFPRIKIFIDRKYKVYHFGEDVAQEFFMKLFRIDIPERIVHPTVWIFNACDNLAKTHVNSQREKLHLPLYEELIAAADVTDSYNCLKNGGISEQNIEVLNKLDAVTIEIFVMYFWEGYNYREIAEKLKMSHAYVRQKATRGLKILKNFLKVVTL